MRSRATQVVVAVVAVVAAVLVGVEQLVGDASVAPTAPAVATAPATSVLPAGVEPVAGNWTCAVGDTRAGTDLAATVARLGTDGAEPAEVDLEVFEAGSVTTRALPSVFTGAHQRTTIDGSDASAVAARWRGGPATLSREWVLDGADDLPEATVAGGCARTAAGTWIVPGMTTEGGNEARLRIANPARSDATIVVSFLTPDGAVEPLVLQNVTVPARGVREILVNDSLPERPDLSAVVRVRAGRVAVEGYQVARSAIGGIDGASLLQASTAPAENWTVPWVADGTRAASWLWVVNPGDRTAEVELTLHTPDGGSVPDGLAEVTVPPGELRRVDLRGTLPEGVSEAAVTARSNGTPIVMSAATIVSSDDPERTGIAVQLGAPATDTSWVVSGGSTADRREQLQLVNPEGVPATVDVALFNGSAASEPGDLQSIEVPAGSLVTVDLAAALGGVGQWTAFVTATDGQVVAGRVGVTTGAQPLRLIAVPGMPSAATAPPVAGLVARHAQGLVRQLGTSFGVRPVDPLDAAQQGADDRFEQPLFPTPDEADPLPDEPDPVEPDPVEPDPVEPDPVEPDPVEPDPGPGDTDGGSGDPGTDEGTDGDTADGSGDGQGGILDGVDGGGTTDDEGGEGGGGEAADGTAETATG